MVGVQKIRNYRVLSFKWDICITHEHTRTHTRTHQGTELITEKGEERF